MIAVKGFTIDAGLLNLWRLHVSHVTLEGLQINIPPGDTRRELRAERAERDATRPSESPNTTPETTAAIGNAIRRAKPRRNNPRNTSSSPSGASTTSVIARSTLCHNAPGIRSSSSSRSFRQMPESTA